MSIGAVCLGASLVTERLVSQSSSPVAFTVQTLEKSHHYPDGQLVMSRESFFGARADGSHVDVRQARSPKRERTEQRTIFDVLQRRRIVIDGLTESITTYNLKDGDLAVDREKRRTCLASTGSERVKILGFEAVRIETTLPTLQGPGGEVRKLESWQATALNCYPLREAFFMGKEGGVLQLVNAREAVSVQLGEPDPSWFSIPSGYVERAPSAVLAEHHRRYQSDTCATCDRMDADRSYWNHR